MIVWIRIIGFKLDYIYNDYKQNNTNRKTMGNTDAEKDMCKLMNSFFLEEYV